MRHLHSTTTEFQSFTGNPPAHVSNTASFASDDEPMGTKKKLLVAAGGVLAVSLVAVIFVGLTGGFDPADTNTGDGITGLSPNATSAPTTDDMFVTFAPTYENETLLNRTESPTDHPTLYPTMLPTNSIPTMLPTITPTNSVPTKAPTTANTEAPNVRTWEPTAIRTFAPTATRTMMPTGPRTWEPTNPRTYEPTKSRTWPPTQVPTKITFTPRPTQEPTNTRTRQPTNPRTWPPTNTRTWEPTSLKPTSAPTVTPRPTQSSTLRCDGDPCGPGQCRSRFKYCGESDGHCLDGPTWVPACSTDDQTN